MLQEIIGVRNRRLYRNPVIEASHIYLIVVKYKYIQTTKYM